MPPVALGSPDRRPEESAERARSQLNARLAQFSTKADDLVDFVAEGGMVAAKAVAPIREREEHMRAVEQQLGTIQHDLAEGVAQIRDRIELLRDPHELSLDAGDEMRRRLDQAIFHRLRGIDLDRVESSLSEPAQLLLEARMAWQAAQFDHAPMQSPHPPTAGGDSASEALCSTHAMHDGDDSRKRRSVGVLGAYSNPQVKVATRQVHSLLEKARAERSDREPTVAKVRPPKELPDEVQQAIVDGYRSGASMKELARVFGVHRTTIRAALERSGEPVRVRMISSAQVATAARLYESGLSLAKVGEKLGFDAQTIATHLRRAGVALRDPHGRER